MYARGVDRTTLLGLLGLAATIAVAIEWARYMWPKAETIFERGVGPMLREHERRAVTGATWLVLASLVAVLCLPAKVAIATLWCSTVADPVASIAGRARWKRQPSSSGKTRLGSAAGMAAAFIGVWLVANFAPGPALVIAGMGMLAERYPGPFDDNLTVSVVVALTAGLAA
jgi:dolichol kinase